MKAEFIHLRVHSSYSLAEGAITPYDMIKLCKKHDMPAVAITDSFNLFGSLEFSLAAVNNGVKPIIGAIISVDISNGRDEKIIYDQILLLAKNQQGYLNLLKLVSNSYLATSGNEQPHIKLQDILDNNEGLILLTGGIYGSIGRFLLSGNYDAAEQLLKLLYDHFGDRLYIELMRHGLVEEEKIELDFVNFAYKYNIPLVATNDVYFSDPDIHKAHDALLCIASGRYVVEQDRRKVNIEHYFKSAREMKKLFEDIPEAINNTVVIAQRCSVMSPERSPILPRYSTDGEDEGEALRNISGQYLENRLQEHVYKVQMSEQDKAEISRPYRERLEYELEVIINMKFPGYFLIVSDFIRWSKRNGVPVGPGRGSGAGSLVAWVLEITDLDPLRFGLLFERFLNPERISMPDFDIDFCQEKREKVIKYVQSKYGNDKVAQIITFGKLQARAVIRDVGRVLQMSYAQVDKISKMIPFNPIDPVTLQKAIDMDKSLREMQQSDPEIGRLIDIALKLEGLNRHCSTHAAGVVIADRPLQELVPVYRDPRSEMPVCGYAMKYAESSGLVKFDFLGLKTLTVIAKACQFIAKRGIEIDISKIPLDDRRTYQMLGEGKSVGVFQLESSGMRDVLRKMKPDTIDDIIALISLYRPGPMDNIPAYIARKHGIEPPDYMHPMLESVLKETYGVIIYQEQVMQIAQIMGGYSLGGADLLRRAMGKKIAAEMDKQRETFVKGAIANKVDKEQASYIFDLVAKFAGYGFNKSHAAAYALISYRTAYLKANFEVEFFAASMNLEISDTDKINSFIQDIKQHNIQILPPDINKSGAYFLPEIIDNNKYAIRYALAACKNVGVSAIEAIEEERKNNGEYKSIFDFISRLDSAFLNKRMLESLIKSGAFDKLNPNRKQLFENIETILKYSGTSLKKNTTVQVSLFDKLGVGAKFPQLPNIDDWENTIRLQEEFSAIGLYLNAHPLSSYTTMIEKLAIIQCQDFTNKLPQGYSQVKLAGVVIAKKMRSSPKGKFANVSLSDATGIFELSIYDEDVLAESNDLLETGNILYINADIRKDEGGVRIVANKLELFDEVVSTHKVTYNIELACPEIANKLKNYIKLVNNSNISINIIFPIKEKVVTVSLPSKYALNLESVTNIKAIDGVIKIEENS